MIVYISGPMTGYEDKNHPAFFEAEAKLKALGHVVLNPARLPKGLAYNQYMDIAMAMVRSSEAIYTLEKWSGSFGARAEKAYADSLGLEKIRMSPAQQWYKCLACNNHNVTSEIAI